VVEQIVVYCAVGVSVDSLLRIVVHCLDLLLVVIVVAVVKKGSSTPILTTRSPARVGNRVRTSSGLVTTPPHTSLNTHHTSYSSNA